MEFAIRTWWWLYIYNNKNVDHGWYGKVTVSLSFRFWLEQSIRRPCGIQLFIKSVGEEVALNRPCKMVSVQWAFFNCIVFFIHVYWFTLGFLSVFPHSRPQDILIRQWNGRVTWSYMVASFLTTLLLVMSGCTVHNKIVGNSLASQMLQGLPG